MRRRGDRRRFCRRHRGTRPERQRALGCADRARDRVGGRTWTGPGLGRQLEYGGTYVHWTQPNMWQELQRHNIPLRIPVVPTTMYWIAEGATHSASPRSTARRSSR